MPQELNWCGEPIRPGESYGGKPEHIKKSRSRKPVQVQRLPKHFEVITEQDVAESFGNGKFTLTRALAAKRLEAHTGADRASCYRALQLDGRFAQHLSVVNGRALSWH
jgi:hypothetical protein